jgi:3-(3-hydroxy-phenyl)propionate hydroxylase
MNSPSIIDTDVLVVGYGPVGAAPAAMLGRYGIRTLVVEKAPDILMAPRAMSLDNEALRILQMAAWGKTRSTRSRCRTSACIVPTLASSGRSTPAAASYSSACAARPCAATA